QDGGARRRTRGHPGRAETRAGPHRRPLRRRRDRAGRGVRHLHRRRRGAVRLHRGKGRVAPAIISVVCLAKNRRADALALFLGGERISAARAAEVGLITRAVPAGELDAEVATVVARLLAGGPSALAAAKRLVYTIPGMERKAAFARTT